MKKLFVLLAVGALFCLCSCDKKSEEDPIVVGSYKFYELCIDWTQNESFVREYVAKMSGWTEDKEYGEPNEISFINSKTNATMTYEFESDALVGASITYFECINDFEKMKSDITQKYGVSSWRENTPMSGVNWWSAIFNEEFGNPTMISIGYSENYGGYMYADFSRPLY